MLFDYDSEIKMYPNPISSNGFLSFEGLEDNKIYSFSLFNLSGQLVFQNLINNNKKIELPVLLERNYIVVLKDQDNNYIKAFKIFAR